ncbi:Protein YhfA [Dyadobacter sp. CECT 9623]|uniref:Protein YhfA n=2 Tax=Spirosomataceae TaxID=2896860 RepID=A0ABN7RBB3_9BACT|nr:Protein YhfA [Dyadobacter sp. CECT 9623]
MISIFAAFKIVMKIELVRVDDAFHFEGSGSSEVKVHTDGSPEIGGKNQGVRPMELLLMGLASCSAIDVVMILKKQRQDITDFRVTADGDREQEENTERKPFRKIHLTFKFAGNQLDEKKINRAIGLSMEKYCSATAQLEALATITYDVEIANV